jgi:Ca2+-binding RTX toxin-like protein
VVADSAGHILYRKNACENATVRNTSRIVILGGEGSQSVIVRAASLAPGFDDESSGIPEIEIVARLGVGTDHIAVRGASGSAPTTTGFDGSNAKVNGDADIDMRLVDIERRTASGGDGPDLLYTNHEPAILIGGRGHDRLIGGPAADLLHGGPSGDEVLGGGGADLLYGDRYSGGDDVLRGGGDADVVYPDRGDDAGRAGERQ